MWPFSSAAANTRSSSSIAASLPLERRLIRVSKADISRVTADDIKRVSARLTNDELTTSLRLLVETNRLGDVLASASSSAWAEAVAEVTEARMGLSSNVMRDRMSLLYNILPYVSDNFLSAMGSSYSRDP
ncbi:hypothetical protein conserved [Leishmania donovani]|uniref:Uncharacterized protein n=3 Tax=Leishmania donovani species complex TaxID=38574 RepID=A4HSA4_LEIIN|nr:conserved hypothetical protein [Leishmania infantum JPCM5]TPP43041.1 hypothetical protein CGC20_9550 [Leishmania donovani]CAC9442090.1 hypothetical_protein_-_conserved [Leishmania infantum]CAJ1985953.1 hypothetical protein conserved [Leishmania donovani]CAM65132.1 conserved hypothetical protein [Leishmania infantum JPCM5]SUZ38904.1 hypothetical_protein_-_conserved [Leishmania infantum]|eukprot:XP_001462946.1 conserved hypothetical protein [Leishmania infantum JPCM5]